MSDAYILSVSRRTDIPAFYTEWFMNRIDEGKAAYVHPYTGKLIEVELGPENIAAIVFWSKNMAPLAKRLEELSDKGFARYLVHYTITGLGPSWEPRVPKTDEAVETFERLAKNIGPRRLLWRFDPIVLTENVGVKETLKRFESLCKRLCGMTFSCFTSVVQPYSKIKPRLKEYENEHHDKAITPREEHYTELMTGMAETARQAGITVYACCTPSLLGFGIEAAACIDGKKILDLWPECGLVPQKAPTRKHCNCSRAVDIGAYDTCPHACLYCYANSRPETIRKRRNGHDPDGPCLVKT